MTFVFRHFYSLSSHVALRMFIFKYLYVFSDTSITLLVGVIPKRSQRLCAALTLQHDVCSTVTDQLFEHNTGVL